ERQGAAPAVVQDLRRVMDNRDIHAVTIATPNHWHCLAAIWAMQAGKHVYVEKPLSHNIWEGRRCVEVARATNKMCQVGMQTRSSPGVRDAIQFIREGGIGQVRVARGLCYKPRGSIGRGNGTVPGTCDYNLWCGPAPQRPLNRQRLHYDWHWQWDFGNGDIGNQGPHQLDVARWALGKNELPRAVQSVGGRFSYTDDGETANTQVAWFDYGEQQLIFEVRGLTTPRLRGIDIGAIIYGTTGYAVITQPATARVYDLDGNLTRTFNAPETHFANWISAIRSGRREDLHADVLEGHLSASLAHLANISYRLGTARPFEPRQNIFGDSANAQNTMVLMEEHLAANNVNLANTNLMVGRRLTVDPTNENFPQENAATNAMLTREYRTGFVVPAS
ncbi:MAG TPA: Gfo/Idh/MocA family oxidoreductase, partial [Gemmataceae bacterium]|nr:Gfo/Idh/MocA family oxidoreductase [Gemmataceae bacterium]